jgi:hypothetical protein
MDVEILSKKLQIENKLFYFDLKSNPAGKYLKITEKSGDRKSVVIVPISGLLGFKEIIDEILQTLV